MLARIYWLSKDDGGRAVPPLGTGLRPYMTVVRFEGDAWPADVAWSLAVEKVETEGEFGWMADVRFLVAEAPHAKLVPDRKFELYEGKKCVATGVLLIP